METQEGALVLADISGYTRFLSQTEIEHAEGVISGLLESVVEASSGTFQPVKFEGDAVFFIADPSVAQSVVPTIEAALVAFRRRQRAMAAQTTCTCTACGNISALRLKFLGHYGMWRLQRIAGSQELFGPDVIVVHRLLKNGLQRSEYALLTRSLAEQARLDSAQLEAFAEDLPDIGVVEGVVLDLANAEERALAAAREGPEQALWRDVQQFDASPEEVFRWWTDSACRGQWVRPSGPNEFRPEQSTGGGRAGERVGRLHFTSTPVFTLIELQPPHVATYLTTGVLWARNARLTVEVRPLANGRVESEWRLAADLAFPGGRWLLRSAVCPLMLGPIYCGAADRFRSRLAKQVASA